MTASTYAASGSATRSGGGGRPAVGRGWVRRAGACADGDISGSTAVVSFGSNNLVVVRAEAHAMRGPGTEVVAGGNGSGASVRLANRPVLLECSSALNGRRIGSGSLVDIVCGAVRLNSAFQSSTCRRVICAEALDDVVLDQRIGGPAVDGEVAVPVGTVGAAERDGSAKRVNSERDISGEKRSELTC